jgi:hypothetical protein
MKQIRIGVFETNSSSTHSLTIVSAEEYKKFKNGKYVWNCDDNKLQSIEDAKKSLIADRKEWDKTFEATDEEVEKLMEESTKTYDDYGSNYETFEEEYETKSGDKIVAFGYYGYDN